MRPAFTFLLLASISLAQMQEELQGFVYELNITEPPVVVVGSNIDATEQALLFSVKALPQYVNFTYVDDSNTTLTFLETERRPIVLIGGPSQNRVSEEYLRRGLFGNESRTVYVQFIMRTGRSPAGARLVLLSDAKGFANIPRRGTKYSPLRFVMDEKYVPAVATGISLSLMALFSLGRTFLERFALGIVGRGKRLKEAALKLFGIKLREVASLVGATIVLAVAITWVFTGPTADFWFFLLVNMLATFMIIIAHELVHMLVGRIYGLRTEYVFWPIGSLITLLSAFLGNPFGLAGYLIEEEAGASRKGIGLMKLSAPLFSTALAIVFALINLFAPWEAFQMIFTISSTIALVELTPFEPLAGAAVRRWNPFIWFFSYCAVAFFYVVVNFIL